MTVLPDKNKRLYFSFSYKLMLAFFLVVALPVTGLSLHNYLIERRNLAQEEIVRLKASSRRLANEIDKYLVANKNMIRHVALSSEVKNHMLQLSQDPSNINVLNQWLTSQAYISDEYAAVFILDKHGYCIASSVASFIGNDYGVRLYYKKSIQGKFYKSDWAIGLTTGRPGFFLSMPIWHNSEVIGVLVFKIRISRIDDLVSTWNYKNSESFLLNHAGIILTHTTKQYNYMSLSALTPEQKELIAGNKQFAGKSIKSLNIPGLQQTLVDAESQQSVLGYYQFQGEKKLAALTYLKEQDWAVGLAVPESSIHFKSGRPIAATSMFFGIALAGSALIGFLVSQRITRPIRRLNDMVHLFEDGRLQTRVSIDSKDEIGQLANSFNQMAETISTNTQMLEHKVRERTKALEAVNEALKKLSVRDPLTGCYNRRYLEKNLLKELNRALRYGRWLTVIMCDVDHFKMVNDTHGHSTGDEVLRTLVSTIEITIRDHVDWVARYGGEEFVIVLPETNEANAKIVAERMRKAVENQTFSINGETDLRITASFGVTAVDASTNGINLTAQGLIESADLALYSAKEAGRNKVVTRQNL